jgi:hypothetical protein
MDCDLWHSAFVTGSRRNIHFVPETFRHTGEREAADLIAKARLLVALSGRASYRPVENLRLNLAELTFNGVITVFAIGTSTGSAGRCASRSLIRRIHRLANLLKAGLELGRGRNKRI